MGLGFRAEFSTLTQALFFGIAAGTILGFGAFKGCPHPARHAEKKTSDPHIVLPHVLSLFY